MDLEGLFTALEVDAETFWRLVGDVVVAANTAWQHPPSEETCQLWTRTFAKYMYKPDPQVAVIPVPAPPTRESHLIQWKMQQEEQDVEQLMWTHDWWRPTPAMIRHICFTAVDLTRDQKRQREVLHFMVRLSEADRRACGQKHYRRFYQLLDAMALAIASACWLPAVLVQLVAEYAL